MTALERIKVLDVLVDRLTYFSDEGCVVYVCTPSGDISIVEYDRLLCMVDEPTFGLESVFATRSMSNRSTYDSEGKIRFGIRSDNLNLMSLSDNPNANRQVEYILKYLPKVIDRIKSELEGYIIETSLSWYMGDQGSIIKIFKNDPFAIDQTFKSMGYRYPRKNTSLEESPRDFAYWRQIGWPGSFQIQFEVSKKSEAQMIKKFINFVSSS